MPTKKKKSSRQRIPIIIAVIGIVGTLGAAIIGILPKLLELAGNAEEHQTTNTSIVFNKYDDPLGLYSISLPSDLVLQTRETSSSGITAMFIPREYSLDPQVDINTLAFYILIAVGVQGPPATTEDIEKFNEEIVNGLIKNNDSSTKNLIFNQKTAKGFFVKYKVVEAKSKYFVYTFSEWDKSAFVLVAFVTKEFNDLAYSDSISFIISDFKWYPDKITKYLASTSQ